MPSCLAASADGLSHLPAAAHVQSITECRSAGAAVSGFSFVPPPLLFFYFLPSSLLAPLVALVDYYSG